MLLCDRCRALCSSRWARRAALPSRRGVHHSLKKIPAPVLVCSICAPRHLEPDLCSFFDALGTRRRFGKRERSRTLGCVEEELEYSNWVAMTVVMWTQPQRHTAISTFLLSALQQGGAKNVGEENWSGDRRKSTMPRWCNFKGVKKHQAARGDYCGTHTCAHNKYVPDEERR